MLDTTRDVSSSDRQCDGRVGDNRCIHNWNVNGNRHRSKLEIKKRNQRNLHSHYFEYFSYCSKDKKILWGNDSGESSYNKAQICKFHESQRIIVYIHALCDCVWEASLIVSAKKLCKCVWLSANLFNIQTSLGMWKKIVCSLLGLDPEYFAIFSQQTSRVISLRYQRFIPSRIKVKQLQSMYYAYISNINSWIMKKQLMNRPKSSFNSVSSFMELIFGWKCVVISMSIFN